MVKLSNTSTEIRSEAATRPRVFLAFFAASLFLASCFLFLTSPALGISHISILNAEITLSQYEYVYSGDENKPAVISVTLNGEELKVGEDYTVSYMNNISAGTALVRIAGINRYTDAANKEFTISKRPVTISAKSASKTYDGSALLASTTGYTASGLVKTSDLKSVELSGSQTNAGKSESVVGACVFEGELGRNYAVTKVNGTLTVEAAPITDLVLSPNTLQYTGSQLRPETIVHYAGGIVPSSVYDVVWPDDTTNPGTKSVFVVADGNYTGVARATYTIEDNPSIAAMYRLYNPNSGEHFYTANAEERDGLIAVGWNDEGTGWIAPATSDTPVYRLYNPYGGEHHYTMDASERDGLISAGWSYEGVGWYSDDAKTVALYRDYNPNQFANNHNYTVSVSEHEWLISLGWQGEGLAWYAVSAADQ